MSDALHQQLVQDPDRAAAHWLFERDQRRLALDRARGIEAERGGGLLTIPVVVHIIHNNGPENIPDAQVYQALEHMNEAFANTGVYDPLTGVPTGIAFCLAVQDPNGNATTGIDRVQSALTDVVPELQDLALKDLVRWDPTAYLNIWVVKEITSQAVGAGVAGYAYLPSSHGQPEDGIVVEANYFGLNPDNSKVAVHEAGHYLGLYHTFEGGCANNNCLLDGDRVCDTPPDGSTSTVTCGTAINTCATDQDDPSPNNPFRPIADGGLGEQDDMIINYMDYGSKVCQTAFSQGQADRMNDALTGTRQSLLASPGCTSPCTIPFAASFTTDPPNPVTVGATVDLINTTGPATSFVWTLNGSVIGTQTDASYTFNTEGTYTVLLTASDTVNSCLSTTSFDIVVDCPGQASFDASSTSVLPGTTIDLNNTSTNAVSYAWYLDGNLYSNAMDLSLTLTDPGAYSVYLVADEGSCVNTSTTTWLTVGDCREDGYRMNWLFGDSAWLDFNSGSAVSLPGSAISSSEGVSSISDGDGQLLFYTNGVTVWDRTHQVMPNGTGLLGGALTSAYDQCIIAPDPANPRRYYIFTHDEAENGYANGMHYSIVDMDQNGGLGDVVVLNTYLCPSDQELLAGVTHANGTDSWICLPRRFPNARIDMIHVDATGTLNIVSNPIAPRINPSHPTFFHSGKKIVFGSASPPPVNVYVRIMDVDQATGLLSNPIELFLPGGTGFKSMEVSPDDSKLYMIRDNALIQFDLSLTTQAAIQASETVITQGAGVNFDMLSAPDGRIYVARVFGSFTGVIEHPDSAGLACSFQPNGMTLDHGRCRISFPKLIRGPRFGGAIELDAPATACVGTEPTIQVLDPDTSCQYTWLVNGTPVQATSGDTLLVLPYLAADSSVIRVNKACDCGYSTTAVAVQYVQPGSVDLGPDTAVCSLGPHWVGPSGAYASYLWSDGTNGPQVDVTPGGEFWVQVTDSAGCVLSDTIHVDVAVTPPLLELGPNDTICPGGIALLDAGPDHLSYLWQDGSTEQIYTAFQPGTYSVTVTNGCGSATDSITILSLDEVPLDLGPDTVLCAWSPILLDAGTTGISWLWQDGSSDTTLLATSPGMYWVEVADSRGCMVQDTILLALDTLPPILNCPEDTLVFIASDATSAYIQPPVPVVVDDCAYSLTNSFTGTGDASGNYPIGATTITWTATDANGSVTCTQVVTVDNSLGISDPSGTLAGVLIRPNPGAGQFVLDLGGRSEGSIDLSVFDAAGAVVFRDRLAAGAQGPHLLDLTDLAVGPYTLQLVQGTQAVRFALVIVR
ncbi:MAG: PKD domain-containing protein [Flavobacteriales bacterium]|nr:PKD domain-containing protein [Flavobacteriales bacterium]